MTIEPENQANKHLKDSSFREGIEALNLSQPSYNRLKRANKHTIEDLLLMTSEELINIKYFANNSSEFIQKLESLGLYLIDDPRSEFNINVSKVKRSLDQHSDYSTEKANQNLKTIQERRKKYDPYFELYKQGLSLKKIADKFNVSQMQISRYLRRHPDCEKWKKEQRQKQLEQQLEEESLKREKQTNRQIENSIYYAFEEQVKKYWDWEENQKHGIDPYQVQRGSEQVIYLKCPIDSHSWQKKARDITKDSWEHGRSGCRVCAGRPEKLVSQPTLNEAYSEFVDKYWDFDNNSKDNLDPKIITCGSNRKARFKCSIHGFEWKAYIASTIAQWSKGNSGCKVCNGTEIGWNHKTILAFVKSLTSVISSLEPAELYRILRQNGLISASKRLSKNKDLLKDIVKLTHIADGEKKEKALENIRSKLEMNVIEISTENQDPINSNIEEAETDELKENKLPSHQEIIEQEELPSLSPQNILKGIDSLKSLIANPDEEAVEFFISKAVAKLWKEELNNEELPYIEEIKKYEDGEYSAEVKKRFFSQYEGATSLEIPDGYSFKINGEIKKPNLMQRLIAYRVLTEKRVGNWSGTGAGKTITIIYF